MFCVSNLLAMNRRRRGSKTAAEEMLQLVFQRPPSARKFTAYLRIAVLFTEHCFSAKVRAK